MKKIKSLKKSQIFDSQLLRKEKCNRVMAANEDSEAIRISGGSLQNVNGGVNYVGDDGTTCYFEGVTFAVGGLVMQNTAYYF